MSADQDISDDHPAQCAACHAPGGHLSPIEPGLDTGGISLLACDRCGSVTMWPQPDKDYTAHAGSETELRDYVEMNCSIHDITKAVMPAVLATGAKRYLDVGCGFGFSLDIVRRLAGCDVVGIEPAHYGRAGRDLLGVPILPDVLSGPPGARTPAELSRPFDVIFASEVIEHVSDPGAFLDTLSAYLAPDGMLALTTPRAAAVTEAHTRNEKLAVISPGAHVFLYSAAAFEAALRRAGYPHVVVIESGVTQMAYAARVPFSFPELSPGALTTRYLQSALETDTPREPVRTGLQYRLYRSLIEQAQWEAASSLDRDIEIRMAPQDMNFADYDAFLAKSRASEPSLSYLRGILYLVHERRRVDAHHWFMSSFRLCCAKLQIAPSVCAVEADMVWRALFHAALSARHSGDRELAARTWRIAEEWAGADFLPEISEELRERADRELKLSGG